MNLIISAKNWLFGLSLLKKIILSALFVIAIGLIVSKVMAGNSQAVQYQTSAAQKGTLIVSVSGSGQVSATNTINMTTQASGVVKKLYVQNDDMVKTGQAIAEIDLDLIGQQRQSQALASYESAKNNLNSAQAAYYALQSDMLTKWNSYMNLAQNGTYQNSDGSPNDQNRALPQFMSVNDDWLSTEAKYNNQQNVVNQAQISLNSAWLSYQQSSAIIYAPLSGKVSGLSLQVGAVINATSGTDNSATSIKIGNIKTDAAPLISVNLTQIDIPKVKIGDRATLTFDAFPDKTFTGKVVSIDTAGSVSSGVTNYPTIIKLDTNETEILPNMTATANIITDTKDNAVYVPSTAVQMQSDGTSYVRILKNNQPQNVTVETGLTSDTDTEIVSGISEGQEVITAEISTASQSTSRTSTQSVFSGLGGGGAFRTGGNFGGGGAGRAATGR